MADERYVAGTDVRRAGMSPNDAARAQGLAARYGGTVTLRAAGLATVAVDWRTSDGQVMTAYGDTAGAAMQALATFWEH